MNFQCGADFVKTQQKLPPSLADVLKPGERAASFDGDADRIIYYSLDERGQFYMLDGDKIAALVTAFISDLVKGAGLEGKVDVGVVQTAYANGSSTKYLSDVRIRVVIEIFTDVKASEYQYDVWQLASSICIMRPSTFQSVFTLKPTVMGL